MEEIKSTRQQLRDLRLNAQRAKEHADDQAHNLGLLEDRLQKLQTEYQKQKEVSCDRYLRKSIGRWCLL